MICQINSTLPLAPNIGAPADRDIISKQRRSNRVYFNPLGFVSNAKHTATTSVAPELICKRQMSMPAHRPIVKTNLSKNAFFSNPVQKYCICVQSICTTNINRAFLQSFQLFVVLVFPVAALLHHLRTKGVALPIHGLE